MERRIPQANRQTHQNLHTAQGLGLIDKDRSYYPDRVVEQDYDTWERDFLGYNNVITYREVASKQKDMIFYCSDYQFHQLIGIRPKENSSYIRSSTEPFNDEMAFKEERVKMAGTFWAPSQRR
jgi:ribonuclease J